MRQMPPKFKTWKLIRLAVLAAMVVLLSERGATQPNCGKHANLYNGRQEVGGHFKAASCIITTFISPRLCNGGGSFPDSSAWVNLTTSFNPNFNWVQVGYGRGRQAVGGGRVQVLVTSYFYEFHFPGIMGGACTNQQYDVGSPAAGAQAYSITRLGRIWRVTYGNQTVDSAAGCATCDGVSAVFSAETHQNETCCVGSRADVVAYTSCQVDDGNGQRDPNWAQLLSLPFFPPGTAAFVQQNATADSFEIYDARN
jgi:hypothetical protein